VVSRAPFEDGGPALFGSIIRIPGNGSSIFTISGVFTEGAGTQPYSNFANGYVLEHPNSDATVFAGASTSEHRAAVLDSSGNVSIISPLPSAGPYYGNPSTSSVAISDDGTTAAANSSGQYGRLEALIWTADGGSQGLGVLPGAPYSSAVNMSNNGQFIVGYSGVTVSAGASPFTSAPNPFIWDEANGIQRLLSAGFDFEPSQFHSIQMFVQDVTNDGAAIGYLGLDPKPGVSLGQYAPEGFITPLGGKTQLIRDYVHDLGIIDLDYWSSVQISAISSDGRTLVGTGVNSSGLPDVWVVMPTAAVPEANTMILCGMAVLTMGLMARRRRAAGC
jgi:hypothetical protein